MTAEIGLAGENNCYGKIKFLLIKQDTAIQKCCQKYETACKSVRTHEV